VEEEQPRPRAIAQGWPKQATSGQSAGIRRQADFS
jgi:hypothetical protein